MLALALNWTSAGFFAPQCDGSRYRAVEHCMAKNSRLSERDAPVLMASLVLLMVGCNDERLSRASVAPDANSGAAGAGGGDAAEDQGGGDATEDQGGGGSGCVPSESGDATNSDGPYGVCPANLPGPTLVAVPAPQGCTYCIDSTEVTNAHYAAFVAAKRGDTSGQRAECNWNTSFDPAEPLGDDYPVLLDWCDAVAYCKWAGKRLCGRIGGGAIPSGEGSTASVSEWYNACSKGGTRVYSYGDELERDRCNEAIWSPRAALRVGEKAQCEGGYPGLFDMSGNTAEWEDSCFANDQPPADHLCNGRGLQFHTFSANFWTETACSYGQSSRRSETGMGFRCCAPSS
jgi:formylglycine-generating enzyme